VRATVLGPSIWSLICVEKVDIIGVFTILFLSVKRCLSSSCFLVSGIRDLSRLNFSNCEDWREFESLALHQLFSQVFKFAVSAL